MGPWIHRTLDLSTLGSIEAWIYRPLDISNFGSIDPWIYRTLDPSTLGSIELWIYRTLDLSTLGSIDPWIYRPVDLSNLGSIDPWIYRPLDLSNLGSIKLLIYRPLDPSNLGSMNMDPTNHCTDRQGVPSWAQISVSFLTSVCNSDKLSEFNLLHSIADYIYRHQWSCVITYFWKSCSESASLFAPLLCKQNMAGTVRFFFFARNVNCDVPVGWSCWLIDSPESCIVVMLHKFG